MIKEQEEGAGGFADLLAALDTPYAYCLNFLLLKKHVSTVLLSNRCPESTMAQCSEEANQLHTTHGPKVARVKYSDVLIDFPTRGCPERKTL